MSMTSLLPSWQLALESGGKSRTTIRSYLSSVRSLAAFLRANDMPGDVDDVTTECIRSFLVAQRELNSPAYVQQHYRNLSVFWNWLASEGEREGENPMARVTKPEVPKKMKPFFTEDDLARLLRVTSGSDFESRRDHAIIRVFIDTGVRVSGLANLRFDADTEDLTDVFLHQKRLRVVLKGGSEHWIPVGRKSAAAIDRYLRSRARHPRSYSPWLWLGQRNGMRGEHLTDSGVRQMLERRGDEAGVQDCTPHRFRHTFADKWLELGGNVDDLMGVTGWKSVTMPLEYAKGRGIARAAAAHARLSPGDRV
jgi:site-specific recombinase XerD